jgi:membrane fusion protein, multidrug efflux system
MNSFAFFAPQALRRCLHIRRGGDAVLLVLALLVPLLSCVGKAEEKARPKGDVAPVLAAQAVREDVPVILRTIGTVEAFRTVSIRARVMGSLTGVHFREGQDVLEGTPLFTVDPRPYEVALRAAEADLAKEKSKAAIADMDARRSNDLAKQDLVSRQDHERILSAAQSESAAVRSLEASVENARLNLQFCAIASPISGRTSNLLVHEGNLVQANGDQPLVVINQASPIYVSFSIPERRLPEVLQYMGKGADLPVEAAPSGSVGDPALGRLTFVNNAVDPTTGTILLKAEFPNGDKKLWPGEYVQVAVTLTTQQGALVVPASAVQAGQKGDYVLVVKQDMTTEMRPVTTGPRLEGKAIIQDGLQPGETVITDGHLRVVPGGKVAIKNSLEATGAPAR